MAKGPRSRTYALSLAGLHLLLHALLVHPVALLLSPAWIFAHALFVCPVALLLASLPFLAKLFVGALLISGAVLV